MKLYSPNVLLLTLTHAWIIQVNKGGFMDNQNPLPTYVPATTLNYKTKMYYSYLLQSILTNIDEAYITLFC